MKSKTFIEVVCVLLFVVLLCTTVAVALSEPDYDFEETTYTVKVGDCLWQIANEYCPDSMDKREYIRLVMERNDLDSSVIHPGQNLVIYKAQN